MGITLIAAISEKGVIGRNGTLPWHLPADLARFKKLTLGKPCIMGRRTFEGLKRPLSGRQNIVLTRGLFEKRPGCVLVSSRDEALRAAGQAPEIMICGGASIYALFLPWADCMQITRVEASFEGDTRFPSFDAGAWQEAASIRVDRDEQNPCSMLFVTLKRRGPPPPLPLAGAPPAG